MKMAEPKTGFRGVEKMEEIAACKNNIAEWGTEKGWAKAWKADPQVICHGAKIKDQYYLKYHLKLSLDGVTYVRYDELNFQVKFVQFVKDNAGQEVVEDEVRWDLKSWDFYDVDTIHLSILRIVLEIQ